MTSSDNQDQDWLMTPYPEIFSEIMMMVGFSSLESLHRCRQVCTIWNDMIMTNIWDNTRRRNIFKIRIEKNWASMMLLSDEEISHAKWLGNKHCKILVSCSDKERNCIQAHETACKVMDLHVRSFKFM